MNCEIFVDTLRFCESTDEPNAAVILALVEITDCEYERDKGDCERIAV